MFLIILVLCCNINIAKITLLHECSIRAFSWHTLFDLNVLLECIDSVLNLLASHNVVTIYVATRCSVEEYHKKFDNFFRL